MSSLTFCRDGILRIRRGVYDRAERKHYPILLPLTEMEDRWPGMFLSVLDAPVEFEVGLNVREVLLNLIPWSAEVSAIANCRFDLFLEEVRKPLADDHFADLDTLAFVYHQEIAAVPRFERGLDDMFERIPGSRMYQMRASEPVVTDELEVSGAWHCGGYRKATEDFFDHRDNGFALNLSPLPRWHHLRIKVVDHYWLHDRTVGSDHVSHKHGLLSYGNPLVDEVTSDTGLIHGRRVKMQAPGATLHSVILGCLVHEIGFHGSPEEAARVASSLEEQTDECEQDHAHRDGVMGADGKVDPDALARADAEIEAELADEKAREDAEHRAKPFDDKDLSTLEIARAVAARNPDLIRVPEGLPGC